jgi:hypothetical protein
VLTVSRDVKPQSIRLLTFNFYLRPWPIHENYSDFKNPRIKKFAKHFMGNYDVIAFQEVFTRFWKRQILRLALEVRHYSVVEKSSYFY